MLLMSSSGGKATRTPGAVPAFVGRGFAGRGRVAVSLSAGSEADGLAAGILLDATVHALEELQIEVVTWRVGQS